MSDCSFRTHRRSNVCRAPVDERSGGSSRLQLSSTSRRDPRLQWCATALRPPHASDDQAVTIPTEAGMECQSQLPQPPIRRTATKRPSMRLKGCGSARLSSQSLLRRRSAQLLRWGRLLRSPGRWLPCRRCSGVHLGVHRRRGVIIRHGSTPFSRMPRRNEECISRDRVANCPRPVFPSPAG
jgi:hypothetical protein